MLVSFLLAGCNPTASSPPAKGQTAASSGTASDPGLPKFSQLQVVLPEIDLNRYDLSLPGATLDAPEWAGQSADEPYNVREYLQSRVPSADKPERLYLYALAQLGSEMSFIYPEEDRERRGQQLKELEQRIASLATSDELQSGTLDVSQVESILRETAEYRAILDAAQKSPSIVFVTGLDYSSLLPHAQTARGVARLGSLEVYHAVQSDDFEFALDSLSRTLRISRDVRVRGPLICQLVSCAIDAVVIDQLCNFLLNKLTLSPEQLDNLLILVRQHQLDGIDMLLEGFRMEYLLMRNGVADLQSGKTSAESFGLESDGLGFEISRMMIDYQLEQTTVNRWSSILLEEAVGPLHISRSGSRAMDELEKVKREFDESSLKLNLLRLKVNAPVICMLLFPAADQMFEAAARHQTRMRGMELLLSVLKYRALHGKLPDTLEIAAREAEIERIPFDPYSGDPLRYAVIDGRPVIYSVGSDGVDDGGREDWDFGRQPGDFLIRVGN